MDPSVHNYKIDEMLDSLQFVRHTTHTCTASGTKVAYPQKQKSQKQEVDVTKQGTPAVR
jgi:hypothetical protein